jgi:hypothetical protein
MVVYVAARKRYPTPPDQMVLLARMARAHGVSFDDWWMGAIRPDIQPVITTTTPRLRHTPGCVVWPSDSQDCRQWRNVTMESREAWERAYLLVPALPRETALILLGPVLERAGLTLVVGPALIAA